MTEITITHPRAGSQFYSSKNKTVDQMTKELKHKYGKMFFQCELEINRIKETKTPFRIKDKLEGDIYFSLKEAEEKSCCDTSLIVRDYNEKKSRFVRL